MSGAVISSNKSIAINRITVPATLVNGGTTGVPVPLYTCTSQETLEIEWLRFTTVPPGAFPIFWSIYDIGLGRDLLGGAVPGNPTPWTYSAAHEKAFALASPFPSTLPLDTYKVRTLVVPPGCQLRTFQITGVAFTYEFFGKLNVTSP